MTQTTKYAFWQGIRWGVIRAKLQRVQNALFNVSKSGNNRRVRFIQERILASKEAKFLAVNKVTTNKGAQTSGLDGVRKLTSTRKYLLAIGMVIDGKAQGVKRIWIPKAQSRLEKRPLGIPTILDRAKQNLVKYALEPVWEAKFEPHSYGFRPGRGVNDALKTIREGLHHGEKWILDADVEKCFDRIDHAALLDKLELDTTSLMYKQIEAWLKAVIVEQKPKGQTVTKPLMGTPQGGVISPLLSNIAMHGLEFNVKEQVLQKCSNPKKTMQQTKIVRYADDFVILTPTKQALDVAVKAVEASLATVGLKIKPEKTRILHSPPLTTVT